jgi:mycothiol maleylpyruvate isomerase-like protein
MADSPWPTIHEERGALANDLAGLTEEQWGLPSLCPGWTVHQVLAGPATSLLLAATGRTVAFDELAGPGLQTLRTR